jgi:hypothetical protein
MAMFLDTNIFVYAAGADSIHKRHCVQVLEAVARGTLVATTGAEVIQELLHLFSRRNQHAAGLLLARRILEMFPVVLPTDAEVVKRTCALMESYPGASVRDLVHVAVMMVHGIREIVSIDADFDGFSEVHRICPASNPP